eukprot:g7023.t1
MRLTGWLALVLASQTGTTTSEVVEASAVTNVVVTSDVGWDLQGCGVGGCDPRLTRDGDDNTVPDSRWSCEPSLAAVAGSFNCRIEFRFEGSGDFYYDSFLIDHIILYVHESDTLQIAIPFDVDKDHGTLVSSDLITPGLALGEGQRVNIGEEASSFRLEFELTEGQFINLSEVEIYLNVENPEDVVVTPADELFVVNAKTVTNVVATADFWDLRADTDCGVAGCVAGLANDGQDNTVTASRWSCEVPSWYVTGSSYEHDCRLTLRMDGRHTISYILVYVPDSEDTTKQGLVFDVTTSGAVVPYQLTPGTTLGEGQRFNMPRPESNYLTIFPTNATAGQVIEISEVEIYVEVTDTSVPISAAEAWTDVTADSLTTVTALSSESLTGFTADATRDGDDNTAAASRWSCDGTGDAGYCELYFEFNDDYTVSYLELYMHQSADATKEAVQLEIKTCIDSIFCDEDNLAGVYTTKPGTPLGEPERVNLLLPLTSLISLRCDNLTAIGGTLDIAEVEIYFQVPDATPTPAPFASPAPSPPPTFSFERESDDDTAVISDGSRGLEDDDDTVVDSGIDTSTPGVIGDNDTVVDSGIDTSTPGVVGDEDESLATDDAVPGGDEPSGAGTRSPMGDLLLAAVAAVVVAISSNSLMC